MADRRRPRYRAGRACAGAIGGGLDADEDDEIDRDSADLAVCGDRKPRLSFRKDPATTEAERQTEKATLATLGNTDHPNFAREMKLLAEMMLAWPSEPAISPTRS